MNYPYREKTNRVIRAMCSAGYKRAEFEVHTPINTWGDHGETEITVLADLNKQDELLSAVLKTKEIDVVKYFKTEEDGVRRHTYYYCATYDRPEKLTIRDIDKENKEMENKIARQNFERNLAFATPHLLELVRKLSKGIEKAWGYGKADQSLSIEARKILNHYHLNESDQ